MSIRYRTNKSNRTDRSGQALLLVVVMMGGILFLVTAVAGLLMFYQVEHANDAANSTIAIFAADAGLEKGLHYYFYEYDPEACGEDGCTITTGDTTLPQLTALSFQNGATVTSTIVIPPQDTFGEPVTISGSGMDVGGRTIRSLETNFIISP
jgi:hypothetical protein